MPIKPDHNIVGEVFEDYVYQQINQRQKTHFSGYEDNNRTPEQIQYLNNTNAWVKLASSVSISGSLGQSRLRDLYKDLPSKTIKSFEGSQLAESAILFNTLSGNKSVSGTDAASGDFQGYYQRAGISNSNSIWNNSFAYGLGGTEFGLTPPPGIDSVTVSHLNRGSLREATVELKAFNKFQFELIELLYLRLGYMMMLEWGNTHYINNQGDFNKVQNTIIENNWFNQASTNNASSIPLIIDEIENVREKYNGNYDGFIGKVSNFKWDFTPEGIYTITLKLITVGDVIESLQTNLPLEKRRSVENISNDKESEDSTPKINDRAKDILSGWLVDKIYNFTQKTQEEQSKISNNYFILGQKDKSNKKLSQYYIRFKELLETLEDLCVPHIVTDKVTGPPLVDIFTDDTSNFISYHPSQAPLDPRVCIFKFKVQDINMEGINEPEYLQSLPDYIVSTDDGITMGNIMNLYLNFEFIFKCLEGSDNISLFNFLTKICNGINRSLGNVNKLEPVIKGERRIFIQDQIPISGLIEKNFKDSNDVIPLEIYGYNPNTNSSNFVKDFNFTTQISPELSSMISIGAAASGGTTKGIDATGFARWNVGLQDRYQPDYDYLELDNREKDPNQNQSISEEQVNQKLFENWKSKVSKVRTIRNNIINSIKGNILGQTLTQKEVNEAEEAYIDDNTAPTGYYTLSDYINSAKKYTKQQIDKTKRENNIKNNYIVYLAECFGANGVLIGDNHTYTVDSEKVQYKNYDPDFIERGIPTYKEYLRLLNEKIYQDSIKKASENENYKEAFGSGQIGFLPVSLGITTQGISGIKIYNKLSVDQRFLPPNYPDALHFVITQVNHKISNNDWETTLNTISIPQTQNQFKKDENGLATYSVALYKNEALPPEERKPIPSSGRFLIQENRDDVRGRNPVNYVPKGEIIGINKVLQDIHPEAKSAFSKFFNALEEQYLGYKMILNATGRSFERSAELKELNSKNASPGLSKHNYYAAIDFNIIDPNGKVYAKSGDKINWINSGIVDLAKKSGLKWGGEFANYEDDIHFYYDFNIYTAYQNALLMSPEDINKVDGYKVPLGPILGPETETVARNNEFSLNT